MEVETGSAEVLDVGELWVAAGSEVEIEIEPAVAARIGVWNSFLQGCRRSVAGC